MNIDEYRKSVHQGLRRLEELISKANDIVDNRSDQMLHRIDSFSLHGRFCQAKCEDVG